MKKLVLLLGILVAMPAFAQSIFSAGSSNRSFLDDMKGLWGEIFGHTTTSSETTTGLGIHKTVIMDSKEVVLCAVKTVGAGNEPSCDVRFCGGEKTLKYDGGSLEIDKFYLAEEDDHYTVTVYYTNTVTDDNPSELKSIKFDVEKYVAKE